MVMVFFRCYNSSSRLVNVGKGIRNEAYLVKILGLQARVLYQFYLRIIDT